MNLALRIVQSGRLTQVLPSNGDVCRRGTIPRGLGRVQITLAPSERKNSNHHHRLAIPALQTSSQSTAQALSPAVVIRHLLLRPAPAIRRAVSSRRRSESLVLHGKGINAPVSGLGAGASLSRGRTKLPGNWSKRSMCLAPTR